MGDKVIELPVQNIHGDDPWGMRAREKLREWSARLGPTPAERAAQEQAAAASFADLGTDKGVTSRALSYTLGPMAGAVQSPAASAAMMGGLGALNAYATDTQHRAVPALQQGAGAALMGGGTAAVLKGVSGMMAPRAVAAQEAAAAAPAPVPAPVSQPTPIKGGWDPAKIEQVLGNATARRAMAGKDVATSEKVLQRLAQREAPVRDPANMVPVAKAGKEMLKKLTPAEQEARRRWVHTNSSAIQAADAAGETSGEYGQMAQTLKQMAEKYPSPPATLYRGAHLPAEAVDQMAKNGKVVASRMESWSTNPETSAAFARGKDIEGKVPVIFRQHGASGLALNPLESEVLIPHGRAYRVAGVVKAKDGTHIVDVVPAP